MQKSTRLKALLTAKELNLEVTDYHSNFTLVLDSQMPLLKKIMPFAVSHLRMLAVFKYYASQNQIRKCAWSSKFACLNDGSEC